MKLNVFEKRCQDGAINKTQDAEGKKMATITGRTNVAALNISSQIKKHTSDAANFTTQMASGKKDPGPAGTAIASSIAATVLVLNQSKVSANNAIGLLQVAQGGINEIKSLVSTLTGLASQSADGSLDDSKRVMINSQFQQMSAQVDDVANRTRWNGVPLLSGGAGAGAVSAAATQAATGLVASTVTGIAGTLNAASKGFISGQVHDVSVGGAAGAYTVTATVGNQTFYAEGVNPAASGILNLVSDTDTGSIIALDFGADVSGITNTTTFATALKQSLGLTSGLARSSFLSTATAANGGVTSLTVGGNTPSGTYAVRSDATSGKLTMTNGEQLWTQAVTTTGAAQTITFSNGISVNLDNSFTVATGITQMVYQVEPDTLNQVSLKFQLAERATDTLTVNIGGATRSALVITGLAVDNVANATTATTSLANALDNLNRSSAQLGAQKDRLNSTISNLGTEIENLTAAQSNLEDADMAETMTGYIKSSILKQAANSGFLKSLEIQQQDLQVLNG